MRWLDRLSKIVSSRSVERAGIVCAVILAHVFVFVAMALQFRVDGAPVGTEGQVVMASLVLAAPSQPSSPPARQSRPKAVRPKTVEIHRDKPAPDGLKPPAPETVAVVQGDSDDPADGDILLLSEPDALALEQFQPATAAGEPNAPCNLTAMLAAAFAQSPALRQGLDELPAEARSVANAVNLWDGQWPQESAAGGKALLRALLVKAISAARPDCLTQVQRGPVLFLIPDSQTTVVLAIGSGDWTWGDLLDAPSVASNNYFLSLASGVPASP